ncbi:TadE/TadG family type IV pilus assembly protein [Phenylobacterium sp.]|jgi:Flp pilus assembly protein TadG|uniref:TadE/TadG family type IV pilus assembly protein n=1 Tax=Phenylobacterium sp. TaxID=1871053 RepID=UPI002F9597B3
MRAWIRRRTQRLAADQRGATLVEFAIVAPVFLVMLLGTLEVGVLGMMSGNFHGAVLSASRQIRTGQSDGPRTANAFRTLICARMADGPKNCNERLRINVQAMNRFANAAGQMGSDPGSATAREAFDAGGPEQVVLVTATYRWPVVMPFVEGAFQRVDGTHVLIVSRFAFKNEPYQ